MSSTSSSSVVADQTAMHSAIKQASGGWKIPCANTWRSLSDIVIDWSIIYLSTWGAYKVGTWMAMLAIFVIGNRQRALANMLHEAGHQNLSVRRDVNDWIAKILLAPALLNNLRLYRLQHARHHAWLGDPAHDPDYLPRVTRDGDRWLTVYARILCKPSIWSSSMFGHLTGKRLTQRERFAMVLWWILSEATLGMLAGKHFALLFLALWTIARGTVFHLITTFREMTDHYGLRPGGIFRYTREIPDHGLSSILLHPHHNGYHLTHHLYPHIPYCHLPTAHAYLKQLPPFNRYAIVCETYLRGTQASVIGWGARHA